MGIRLALEYMILGLSKFLLEVMVICVYLLQVHSCLFSQNVGSVQLTVSMPAVLYLVLDSFIEWCFGSNVMCFNEAYGRSEVKPYSR